VSSVAESAPTHDGAAAYAVDPSTGLRPRPDVPPDVLAAITAAATQLFSRRVVAAPVEDPSHLAWRFSGRWWARPLIVRRARPIYHRKG
jgi:hypothetical protein